MMIMMGEMMIMIVIKVILMKIMRDKLPIPAYTRPQPYSFLMYTRVQRSKAAKTLVTQIS